MAAVAPQTLPEDLEEAIRALKAERNAVILAHYYQDDEIQDLADVVGDSLALARAAQQVDSDVIAFCGVHFMAETAKILNPERTVVMPDLEAGCSLADGCPADEFEKFVSEHPGSTVITYINCTAAVKALSDVICTSSNAEHVVRSVPADRQILFAPDEHLGSWLRGRTGREMTLWPGRCMVHDAFAVEQLERLLDSYPDALLIAHPECPPDILELAQFVGSTAKLIGRVQEDPSATYIVATESGLLHEIRRRVPGARVIPLPPSRSNVLGASTEASIPAPRVRDGAGEVLPVDPEHGCACAICPHMRRNTMEKLFLCLRDLSPRIELDEETRQRALRPIERMLELSA